jgi:hypothetical protein
MSFRRVNKVQREVEARFLPPMPSGESLRRRCLTLSSRTDVEFALVAVLPAHRSRLKVYSLGQYSISSPVRVVVLFLKT